MPSLLVMITVWLAWPLALSQAEEGFFFKRTLPPQLNAAWDATFYIAYKNGQSASAFVIDKQVVSARRVRLLFLTSDHLVQGNCKRTFGFCPNIATLSGSEGYDADRDNPVLLNQRGWTIHEVEVIDRNVAADIALIGATVDRETYRDLQPIPFMPNCNKIWIKQTIYLIGFPMPSSRTSPTAKPIADPHIQVRRWSRGTITARVWNEDYGEADQKKFYWTGTTADALPGSSGGPALTQDGLFFGVLHSIRVGPGELEDKDPYLGDHPEFDWHSYLTNCQAIARFLGDSL